MTLVAIILATLAAGIGSVWLAALLMGAGLKGGGGSVGPQRLLSLAAGALLATAFMHLLPEAFESHMDAHDLFATLLVGLVFFFLLDKAELWHHGHEHSHGLPAASGHGATGHDHAAAVLQGRAHAHPHGHDHAHDPEHAHAHHHGPKVAGGWAVLTGDSVHCFGDGILIASAFVADMRLGVIAAFSVLAHEVPHHMGDLVVLRQTSPNRRMALVKVSLAGAVTALGGLVGYFLVGQLHDLLPYFLAVASSSFVYVALADLIPQLQKRLSARETMAQIVWLLVGMGLVMLVSGAAHIH
ncbi:ZIP family metal transporter [Acidovorax carolinensis]|uniref:ZIP family metal transporter n=1 Tax=Acidovorax carolinensis TaxID=553814 RepID=A0A240UFP9_9BURK|nr:ZIP family metal transporter [Acidovorax carolinensis]ART54471.1 ZIP family metal transporter [Acidovorax carolinensis]ART59882.1 ZIP family metal transporter [Acidovorax carolinensis]